MRTEREWLQGNIVRIISGTLLIFILLLYVNPLFFGFTVKWVFVTIYCILVFLIPMLGILLLNSLGLQRGIITSIIIAVFFLPYFYLGDKIIEYKKKDFFKQRQSELTKLSLEILNTGIKGDSYELINKKLNDIGIDDFQRNKKNAIFKLSTGKCMFNGFIYSQEKPFPDSAFSIKIKETEKIGENWYSFSCDSLDLN